MKHFFVTTFFSLCFIVGSSQNIENTRLKFKSESFIVVFLDKYGDFELESGWQNVNHDILIDLQKRKISLSGTNKREYTLTSSLERYIEGRSTLLKWNNCISNDGKSCNIRIMYGTDRDLKATNSYLYVDSDGETTVFRMSLEK